MYLGLNRLCEWVCVRLIVYSVSNSFSGNCLFQYISPGSVAISNWSLECARRSMERELLLLAILFQFLTKITIVPQSLCRRNEKPSICLCSKPFARAEESDRNQCQIVIKHWNYSYSHRTEKTLEFDLKWSSSALSFDRFYLLFFRCSNVLCSAFRLPHFYCLNFILNIAFIISHVIVMAECTKCVFVFSLRKCVVSVRVRPVSYRRTT